MEQREGSTLSGGVSTIASGTSVGLFKEKYGLWVCKCVSLSLSLSSLFSLPFPFLLSLLPLILIFLPEKGSLDPSL